MDNRITLKDKRFFEAYSKKMANIVMEYIIVFGIEECFPPLQKAKLVDNMQELQTFVMDNRKQLVMFSE